MQSTRGRYFAWAAATLLALGLWQFGQGIYIYAKAQLAQYLMRKSWEKTLAGAKAVKPWPWADTWPVARLEVLRLGVDVFVLAGASGRTMAFGPGHMTGTPLPGAQGNSVLSGHRDTHFSFLQHLQLGDEIMLTASDGSRHRYHVGDTGIVNESDTRLASNTEDQRLTLVTCYPFHALVPGGRLRYVVSAYPSPVQASPGLP